MVSGLDKIDYRLLMKGKDQTRQAEKTGKRRQSTS
jgi:hypothetical protein